MADQKLNLNINLNDIPYLGVPDISEYKVVHEVARKFKTPDPINCARLFSFPIASCAIGHFESTPCKIVPCLIDTIPSSFGLGQYTWMEDHRFVTCTSKR